MPNKLLRVDKVQLIITALSLTLANKIMPINVGVCLPMEFEF
ncbi:hypothetical protein GAB14E_3717 [Colwellia psychrerythraea]|uniref:Uncharacterized protein n=1 Tax=Colwellia psychrerythraea TaxID=28229 RepID=A0A099KGC2_COLPS|nr:hypothetical protein GAB14E_3717 [Colwellia psychrerythraea]